MVNTDVKIYTTIDSLFDTRAMLLESLLGSEFNVTEYINRVADDFKFIDNDTFKLLYKDRANTIFPHPKYLTKIPDIISSYLLDMDEQYKLNNSMASFSITINFYPYTFTEEEVTAMLNFISKLFILKCELKAVFLESIPQEQLAGFNIILDYDGFEVLNEQFRHGFDVAYNSTYFVLPAISSVKPKDIKQLNAELDNFKEALTDIVDIDFVRSELFSIDVTP